MHHGNRRRRRPAAPSRRCKTACCPRDRQAEKMNHWRSRVLTGLLFWLSMRVHSEALAFLPNTPGGMLAFHFSAAMVDFFLLVSVSGLVSGRLCDDMEALCWLSMIVNFFGFIAYLAYASPVFYNAVMWGITYVQWARLLVADRYDSDCIGRHFFRGHDTRRT